MGARIHIKEQYPAAIQGLYFLFTGIWPVVDLKSFLWVTGPKTDIWLVQTFGILVFAIGMVLVTAAFRRNIYVQTYTLGVSTALFLGLTEVLFVSMKVISAVYLLDAFIELLIIALWALAYRTRMQPKGADHEVHIHTYARNS